MESPLCFMDCEKRELFESELKLLQRREKHPYLHYLIKYLNNGDLLLDLGCGLLVNSNYLKDNGFNVVGLDISFEMLVLNEKKTLPLICGDGLKLPFKENSFGSLLLVDIIEHLPEEKVDEFIEETRRVLKDSGVIFLHIPLEKSLSYKVLNKLEMIWPKNPNHLHDYNLKEITQFIEREKYRILWEHKENGIAYFLGHYLRGIKLFIIVSKFLWRNLQNVFTTSYTACLSLRPYSNE